MDKFGQIEIRIIGKEGNNQLTPDNYDIRDIKVMLENIEDILYPNKKKERPVISFNIEEGSSEISLRQVCKLLYNLLQ